MHFLSNFWCKIIFMCFVNFRHQQDSNSLVKGVICHVTSSTSTALGVHYITMFYYYLFVLFKVLHTQLINTW